MPTSTRPADTAQEVFDLWQRIRKLTIERFGEDGLSFARAKTLWALEAEGPLRPRALADRFGHAAATITDMVDGLERDGLAARTPDPSDRRAVLITITPAGRAAASSARERKRAVLDRVFGVLSAAERSQLSALLARLAASPILSGDDR